MLNKYDEKKARLLEANIEAVLDNVTKESKELKDSIKEILLELDEQKNDKLIPVL